MKRKLMYRVPFRNDERETECLYTDIKQCTNRQNQATVNIRFENPRDLKCIQADVSQNDKNKSHLINNMLLTVLLGVDIIFIKHCAMHVQGRN